ncbi:patatin-like phospholipase family protein [Salinibacter ruber]|jgi:NTE family protein|uniref:Acylesterase/phospholipase RssA n=1 Tax=Salinibacter ruber TaxID=146919 RepID=A0AAW5PDE7_9BACT|nr:patatin-like phospholipase family protein [Salinibacter ruber]MCS4159414.1 putative acylesterase/phospholipase RssA [Salinibacter ruber]MCS4223678.1 putative acylesterase/phospholipase RssA [Salinibacter ruber]
MSESESVSSDLSLEDSSIGLALSGGGFRAAVFHLGALKRLEEAEILPHVDILSTVSGGSITGALYALRCAQRGDGRPGTYAVDDLIEEIKELVTQNLRRQALYGDVGNTLQTVGSFLSQNIRRTPLLADELDQQLFGGALLSDLPNWIVVNAMNLATGKRWKFFADRAGDFRVGATNKTDDIGLNEAVTASAAYPLLTDPYPFRGRWEDFRGDLLDHRWRQPDQRRSGDISRWRRRYGKHKGEVTFPLVDGGIYDNLGLNSLRSMNVDYVIYSSAASASTAYRGGGLRKDLRRAVFSMHSRLGDVTRQHAHEMTHKIAPGDARSKLEDLATEVANIRDALQDTEEAKAAERLSPIANSLRAVSEVGWPPRGPQYKAIAPIILTKTDLAEGKSPFDLPPKQRGLVPPLVEELARVRTDLDAHRPEVVTLLIAQGYFLTDAHLKVGMPELVSQASSEDNSRTDKTPPWEWAYRTIEQANANEEAVRKLLRKASKQKLLLGKNPA